MGEDLMPANKVVGSGGAIFDMIDEVHYLQMRQRKMVERQTNGKGFSTRISKLQISNPD